MTEDEHRNKVYEILEKSMGLKIDFEHNEQGWYDPFIEDCWKEDVSPEVCARSIVTSVKRL